MRFRVGHILECENHRWRVKGIHLGALDQESLVELENVSHEPGWTGEWMTHQLMWVPEILLRNCKVLVEEPA
jgi:hypothetical protein